ncbi:unnamed protein product [Didymodactylos carnosus]|uniref:Uncharacterized protein n=1 Tax=Didymodactylos carnosus TaxID=1234261 RepID=A0A815Z0E2_9BILA|nr:unnamed protein product [Didymodactylos carnosus]CAF4441742.1 unnamed protein product [Didymodactylos carnosus]
MNLAQMSDEQLSSVDIEEEVNSETSSISSSLRQPHQEPRTEMSVSDDASLSYSPNHSSQSTTSELTTSLNSKIHEKFLYDSEAEKLVCTANDLDDIPVEIIHTFALKTRVCTQIRNDEYDACHKVLVLDPRFEWQSLPDAVFVEEFSSSGRVISR